MPLKRLALAATLAVLCLTFTHGCATIKPPRGVRPGENAMTVTAYCPCKQCCAWKRTWYGKPVYANGALKGKRKKVGFTASGTKAKHGTIAADTRLYPFGTIMYVPGYGYGRVEDVGGAIKGEHIDLFFDSHKDALRWGKQRLPVKVWVPGRRESLEALAMETPR